MQDTFSKIGFYCGRFWEGPSGELHNSLTNLAFLLAAGYALFLWRTTPQRDAFHLVLIGLAALIGLGSFAFHTAPSPISLQMDLLPIQLFGLAAMFTLARQDFGLSVWGALLAIGLFFIARQGWITLMPRGALGGGITHVPAIIVLIASGSALIYRGRSLGRYLLAAAGVYIAAIGARVADVLLCSAFPVGFHWLWHLLTALVVALVLIGMVRRNLDPAPNNRPPLPPLQKSGS